MVFIGILTDLVWNMIPVSDALGKYACFIVLRYFCFEFLFVNFFSQKL